MTTPLLALLSPMSAFLLTVGSVAVVIAAYMTYALRRERRRAAVFRMENLPKLSIRDLLWLIVVVVLSVLLWKQNKEISTLHKQQDAARVEVEANQLLAEARQADLEAQIQQLILQLKRLGAMSAQDSDHASE